MPWTPWKFVVRSLVVGGLLVTLSGCGKGVAGPPVDHGPFEKYFQSFEAASKAEGRDTAGDSAIVISFGSLDPNVCGLCSVSFFGGRQVTIDSTKWNNMDDDDSHQSLVWHELGHCLLNRVHQPAMMQDPNSTDLNSYEVPASIMNPTYVNGTIFDGDKQYYTDELFHL